MGQSESSEVSEAFAEVTSRLSALELAEIGTQFNQIYARGGSRGGHLLNREEFSRHFQLPVVLGDRLFAAFDLDKDGMVNFEEFVCGLAICLQGTVVDKAALLFKAFNLSEDEGVSRQELATMLNGSFKSAKAIVSCTSENQSALLVGRNEAEIVQKVVDDAFENCDITKTGKLLPIEFEYWLKRNPQLMEGIFDAICPQMRLPVRQSSLIVPDAGDSANQPFSDQFEVAPAGDLRSEPSLEDIIDESYYQDAITEEDSIPSERKVSLENEPDISTDDIKPVQSPLEVVEDYYAALPCSEQEQAVPSTSEWTEKTELFVDEEGKHSVMEEFPIEDDVASSLSTLTQKVQSLTSKLTKHGETKVRPLSVASLSSPTISLTSLPQTPDLEPERTHIAWLPSEQTRQLLNARQSGVVLEQQFLSSPGLQVEGPFVDPVTELLNRFGIELDVRRAMMTADSVVPDPRGFRTLIANGCYRSALDLAGKFLSANGQGLGSKGQPGALHTHKTMQVWMCRIALLVKLRLYSTAQAELEAFGDFDHPDLYFDYHADIYPEHKGSLVPFSLRLLHAELPQYSGRQNVSLDKLYSLLHICKMIESNLESGLSETGASVQMSSEEQQAALKLWKSRSLQVTYAIGNCLLALKDYRLAVSIFESLIDLDPDRKLDLLSGIGRIYLQLGNISAALTTFGEVEAVCGPEQVAMVKINGGLVEVALANYKEGQQLFQEVLQSEPNNALAVNNLAACLVYQGRLKEAVTVLEELVWRNPAENLQESVLFNLCTAYELESSQSFDKKKSMLGLVASHCGDNVNITCLKIG